MAENSATDPRAGVVLTRDVAQRLDTTAAYLQYLIRARRMPAPARDSTGRYVWSALDIEAARAALLRSAGRSRQARHPAPEGGDHAQA